jgi:hypothetical protein
MFIYNIETIKNRLKKLKNLRVVIMLKLVNNCFKAILFLKKIIINIYNNNLSCFIKGEIKNCK